MDTAFANVEDLVQVLLELEWKAPEVPMWGEPDEAYMARMDEWARASPTWGWGEVEEETAGPSKWAEGWEDGGLDMAIGIDALCEAFADWEPTCQ